jgi:hypothetical protein
VSQLQFLIEVHRIERVVLIAHEGCAFYLQRLNVSSLQLESQQRDDMRKAIARVQALRHDLRIDAFFARIRDGRVGFEPAQVIPRPR